MQYTVTGRWAAAFLVLWVVGCKKSDDPLGPAASQACQLQTDVLTVTGSNGRQVTTYTHNANGQLTSSVTALTLANGTASNARTTTTYTYDGAGNLTAETTQGTSTTTNSSISYEYASGRLAKSVEQDIDGTTTSQYTYNSAGQLATYTITEARGTQPNVRQHTYTNGILTAAVYTVGGVQSGTVAVSNGRIASLTFPGDIQVRYTYDANGYVTRFEYVFGGSTTSSQTIEYGTGGFLNPLPVPTNAPETTLYGKTDLPVSRVASFQGATLLSETRVQTQKNAKNYPTSISISTTENGRTTASNQVFTYSNCQ
jgi:YD repeat-containing protein